MEWPAHGDDFRSLLFGQCVLQFYKDSSVITTSGSDLEQIKALVAEHPLNPSHSQISDEDCARFWKTLVPQDSDTCFSVGVRAEVLRQVKLYIEQGLDVLAKLAPSEPTLQRSGVVEESEVEESPRKRRRSRFDSPKEDTEQSEQEMKLEAVAKATDEAEAMAEAELARADAEAVRVAKDKAKEAAEDDGDEDARSRRRRRRSARSTPEPEDDKKKPVAKKVQKEKEKTKEEKLKEEKLKETKEEEDTKRKRSDVSSLSDIMSSLIANPLLKDFVYAKPSRSVRRPTSLTAIGKAVDTENIANSEDLEVELLRMLANGVIAGKREVAEHLAVIDDAIERYNNPKPVKRRRNN